MRHIPLLLLVLVTLFEALPAAAGTWGTYNPSTRSIVATAAGRSLTVQMPYPGTNPGSYAGTSGGKYLYNTTGGQYRLALQIDGESLIVTIDSTSGNSAWNLIRGPRAVTSGIWRRVDLSQYGMHKGHDFNQKGTYLTQQDLWAWAFWRPEVGKGTLWSFQQAVYNANSGSGNPFLAPQMRYHANTAGARQPLHEEIEIRVDDELWQAVPTFPASRKSQWAEELVNTVLIDSWSHDSAADLTHFLQTLQRIAGRDTQFFTIWAAWGAGGHDAYTPDSIWLNHNPSYPPNHTGFGSLSSMRSLADVGDAAGWMTFRTYYSQVSTEGPSYLDGLVHNTLNADGSVGPFSKLNELPPIYQRQEPEIKAHLGSSGSFTDSLSTGYPSSHRDYDAAVANGLSTEWVVQLERTMADYLEQIHGGPVTGEAVSNEVLLGPWVATGQFDMHNGRGRRMTPEYKLRRLHGLSVFHGMGQNYRFTDISERWQASEYNRNGWRDQALLDDYRATQILFGNGGYLYLENQLEEAPWAHYLSEVLIVAPLQQYFALQPVTTIEYETSGQAPGTWSTLESLVEDHGFVMKTNTGRLPQDPWTPKDQSPEFDRIRVTYANGLTIVVNRGSSSFAISAAGQALTLPAGGWAAWDAPAGNTVLAYSAFAPGTSHRIDFLQDQGRGVRYVDPRGATHFGVDKPTQWVWKNGDWRRRLEAALEGNRPLVMLEGQAIPLAPSRRAAASALNVDFSQGLQGWRTIRGAREATITTEGLELDLTARAGFLHSPRLALSGSAGDTLEVDVRFTLPTSGTTRLAVLFQREQDVAYYGSRKVEVDAGITGGWQTLSIPVGNHSAWDGETITGLRIDPAKANLPAPPVQVTLGAVRWVPAQ